MKPNTRGNAILAKCHDCTGYYADGKVDCEVVKCPLYTYMPYRAQEPDISWTERDPKRQGIIAHIKISRPFQWAKTSKEKGGTG